jgi:L-ribulose-5-phosphate 3-epimerase
VKVRDYLATFDTGSLAVSFDPANFLVNGHDPLAAMTDLAGRVAYFQARDARSGSVRGGAEEVPVGAGDIDWMLYMATLEAIDYRGYLTVQRGPVQTRAADIAAGVKFLRRFVAPVV